ncbi:MAG: cardiolipin synthase [Cellulosilyticaceae bacterium]
MDKMIKKLLKFLFSRMFIVGMLILIQLMILFLAIWTLGEYFVYAYIVFIAISLLTVLYILNKKENPSYKLAWVIPILLVPVFGGLFYVFVGGDKAGKRFRKECNEIFETRRTTLFQDEAVYLEIQEENKAIANQAKYIMDYAGYPIYKNTTTTYLSPGEKFFEVLIKEMKEAKHFIFMEYFIIEEGKMWDTLLKIMEQKVKEGVDVRVIYDDAGTIQTLPIGYAEYLRTKGIKVGVFNEIKAQLSLKFNNRDHRKITVIDGYTGFTGGINLADEYINEIEKFGHWKDTSLMVKGEAVANLTIMFLQAWEYITKKRENTKKFMPYAHHPEAFESDGYVQPYGDSPLDDETVGENVYLNMIHKATDYVYINTPYLIVDNELMVAITLAAKSGVDVRIVTPHIEDKWYVHLVTRAYYQQLIEAGVKIYEYTPGFIHSKTFVADDEVGVVGTINLDYRSLYLHFECGVWLYKTRSVLQIKEDFLETLKICMPITLEECHRVRWYVRFIRSILRVFAPLM